jgi:tetratricopeptide (TPR) repeat protein
MIRCLNTLALLILIVHSSVGQSSVNQRLNQAREYFNQGIKYGIAEEFESAVKDFEKAIELNPVFAEAFLYKGLAEIELGNYDQAIKDFTITFELDPGFADQVHYFRGLAKYFNGEFEQSIDDLTIAIKKNPDFVSFYQRGKANLQLKEYRRSLQDFDIALRLNDEFYEANLYRGINLYHLEKYDEALEDLQLAFDQMPANAEARYYLDLTRRIKNGESGLASAPDHFDSPARVDHSSAVAMQTSATQSISDQSEHQQTLQTPAKSTELNFAELFGTSKSSATQPVEQSAQAFVPERIRVEASPAARVSAESRIDAQILSSLDPGLYDKYLSQMSSSGFGVQIASYSSAANLANISQTLSEKYSQPVLIHVSHLNDRKLYKLILGQFEDKGQAEMLRTTLRNHNFPDSFLVVLENL